MGHWRREIMKLPATMCLSPNLRTSCWSKQGSMTRLPLRQPDSLFSGVQMLIGAIPKAITLCTRLCEGCYALGE
ncbi:hypothetical protein ASPTUDRAFT_914336 [Aspergillus tubingensis CBS 134.48]|uniref:Uncharacterized protein n=1 Tax=Aspergillus tubingensis (strain CBS 134.48) TaxID=767770 RepID=A0A1L9NM71_ASPTC|nr:hypothetical protein ASPTUDRAFT_914336 [Aspergillus tubingensis CBS 134.48]